jgi:hypothetical protein
MKKLNAVLLALLVFGLPVGYAIADSATINTPKNEKGMEPHPLYGGYKYTRITSGTETLVCSGPCLLGELYMSTGATGTAVTVRDTAAADGAGSNVALKRGFVTDTATSYESRIHRPVRMPNGISVQLNSVSDGEQVTVLYIETD